MTRRVARQLQSVPANHAKPQRFAVGRYVGCMGREVARRLVRIIGIGSTVREVAEPTLFAKW